MKNVSNEFKELMKERGDFYPHARITFANGEMEEFARDDFTLSGTSVVDGDSGTTFPLGVAMAKQLELSIFNDEDQFSEYDFYNATIVLYLRFDLSATTESILLGTFTVTTPETYGTTITVTALDDMYKFNADYSTQISFPTTLGQMVRDSCATCNVSLLSASFANGNYIVNEQPGDVTHRNVIAYAAQIAGGNARIDENNRLVILPYDFSPFENYDSLNGGKFDGDTPYSSGDTATGGTFNPWNTETPYDGGVFVNRNNIHVFTQYKNGRFETDDVVITGVRTTVNDVDYEVGEEAYLLEIDNPLITGNEQEAIDLIGAAIIGLRFRPFEIDNIAYPLAEFGDLAYVVDRKGNSYQTVITSVDFNFYGFTAIKCSADSPIRNSSKFNTEATKAYVKARQSATQELTAYDLAVQQLTNLVTQSFGVYKTEEVLEDGSTVFYMHNKPTLGESQTIWRMAADVFSVSTDGGATWNAGMDSEGNAVLNVLSVIGLNARWIITGLLQDQTGKNYWNLDTGEFNSETVNTTIKQNTDSITAEVARATGAESTLSSRITQTADSISLKVSYGEVSTQLSVESGGITLTGNRIAITSDYFKLPGDGVVTCTGANINGTLTTSATTHSASLTGGRLQGYYGGDMAGYFDTYATYNGTRALSVGGYGGITLRSPNIAVYDGWTAPGTTVSVSQGGTGSLYVTNNLSITANSSGGVSWSYNHKTLQFINGIMVTAL